jgi:hypothetical protein
MNMSISQIGLVNQFELFEKPRILIESITYELFKIKFLWVCFLPLVYNLSAEKNFGCDLCLQISSMLFMKILCVLTTFKHTNLGIRYVLGFHINLVIIFVSFFQY